MKRTTIKVKNRHPPSLGNHDPIDDSDIRVLKCGIHCLHS